MLKIRKLLFILLAVCLMTRMSPAGINTAQATTLVSRTEVVLAVIDTGVDYTHKDLADKMKLENGLVKGYNAITKQESGFMDDSADSHGTMTAGVIAAEIEKGKGLTGTVGGSNVKIMPIKALDANGNAKMDDVVDGVKWAIDNEADVINLSFGDWLTQDNYPVSLAEAIAYAHKKGVLVVAAAGNTGENISQEKKAYYPAVLPEILSVGSTGPDLQPSEFSNTGAKLYAPGEDIYSTQISNTYGYSDGTSLAAAQISGELAVRLFSVKAANVLETAAGDGTNLKVEEHHDKPIMVSYNGHNADTAPLQVTTEPLEGADLSPAYATFDQNRTNQADVITEIKWWGSALSVTDVKNGDTSIGTDRYNFSKDSENKYILTIKKEYLMLHPEGKLTLTVEFTGGSSAQLTIDIQDTTVIGLPYWPDDSALTAKEVAYNSVLLEWTMATGDAAIMNHKIYQNGELLEITGNTNTFYKVTGLLPSTEYKFQVQAGDSREQWTTDRLTLTVTTPQIPTSNSPTWPEGSALTVSSVTLDTVNLSWPPAEDDVKVTGYKIYQDGKPIHTIETSDPTAATTYGAISLSPATTYYFQIQAGDADGQWTTDGPAVNATTKSLTGPEIVELKLNAPRKNIKGSLYMGDAVKIELISTETGLEPEVTVDYKEWNSERTNKEEKSKTVTLVETSSGSKKYTGDFTLTEGICSIVSLEGVLPQGPSKKINLQVAGRLKAIVQPSTELSPEQAKAYNEILASSFVIVSRTQGDGSFRGQAKDGNIIVEGVQEAEGYIISHYDAKYQLIYQSQSPTINVKGGLETVDEYNIGTPSDVKVRVVDDVTGLPVNNVTVIGKTTHFNGKTVTGFRHTGENGYAVSEAPYFIKNALKGSPIEFNTTYYSKTRDGSDWYEDGSLKAEITSMGDNEFEIRIKKGKMATVTGTVKNSSGAPVAGAGVHLSKTVYKDGKAILDIYLSSKTDANGRYTMQVAKNAGEVEVTFSSEKVETKKNLKLEQESNTLDITLPPYEMPVVELFVETEDLSGNKGKLIADAVGSMPFIYVNIVNKTTGATNWSSGAYNKFYIPGKPGDVVEVSVDGLRLGFEKSSATAVIDPGNYAKVNITLKSKGQIRANFTDQNGDPRIGENRYMYLYEAVNGNFVGKADSTAPNIAYTSSKGKYNIIFSWDDSGYSYYQSWQYKPESEYVKVENIEVKDNEVRDLGAIGLNFHKSSLYFKHNAASRITSNNSTALPGSVVTIRVAYDFDRYLEPNLSDLDLVAQIPLGTTYVEKSAVHKMTRGNSEKEQPLIEDGSIILDLKDSAEGAAGTLTYQVKVNNPASHDKIRASGELRFTPWASPRSEMFASLEIPTKMITLDSPLEIGKGIMANPVKFSGLAPDNKTVELYDGNIKIGEAKATQSGQWIANVVLPDLGAPVFHHITAKTVADGVEYSDKDLILVGLEGVQMTQFTLTQGSYFATVDLRYGSNTFPFPVMHGDFLAGVSFSDNDKVKNVTIAGCNAIPDGNEFRAKIPYSTYTSSEIFVDYQEDRIGSEDLSQYLQDVSPPFLATAEAEFVDGGTTTEDVQLEYGGDGYLRALDIPKFRLTMEEGTLTAGMKLEPAVDFDVTKAKNRTDLGNGLYGYDFSYELIDGKYVITAYLDRRLLAQPADYQVKRQTTLHAAKSGIEVVKAVVDVAGKGNDLIGAYGDMSTSAKMTLLMSKYENVRPNLQPHLTEYYDKQMELMGKDILMSKTLGLIGKGVGKAENLVPVLGKVVVGAAGLVFDKLLGDMFGNEFDSDYGRLMTQLKNEPGGDKKLDYESYETHEFSNDPWHYHAEPIDSYWYWYWYVYNRDWMDVTHYDDDTDDDRKKREPLKPKWIYDPSGFVYEAVEENRIVGATATALYLPAEKAGNAGDAKDSTEWEFWDAEWYLQINPQITDVEGKYAWDVPMGWWMVEYVKEGYQTAYSDALPVPPPQLEVNIPMVKLEQPKVEKTIWGSGGRYVDVYFSKYMDARSLGEANSNSMSLEDVSGGSVSGSIEFPIPVKTGVNGLSLTKVVRFVPDVPLTSGEQYTLTVNKAVADYAGFSMIDDHTEIETVPDGALIKNLTGSDLTVEPGKDITQDILDALTFSAVKPGGEVMLDKRVDFISSNVHAVSISGDGKAASHGEGTAKITATPMDDPSKMADFTVTVAYPSAPIRISHMAILDKNGRALTDLSIQRGSTYKLVPNISPANATDKNMSYTSDNPAVASVDQDGKIQALSEGIATITAWTEDQNISQKIFVTVTPPGQSGGDDDDGDDDDGDGDGDGDSSGGSNGGSGGSSTTPPANTTIITPEQINGSKPFELQFEGLKVGIDPKDLPTPPKDGSSIRVHSSLITDPNALNTFFLKYPDRQGIMKGYNVTFTWENKGQTENITELNGEITLTFRLTPEELRGIDPDTLVVYKEAEDGSITEYSGEFDRATNSLQISTSHLSKFYIMGEKGISTQRLAGFDRYATATAISAQGWQTSDYVVLASGEVYPDALAGSVLAGLYDAPILLTERDGINEETLKEIERLRTKKIFIMGGSGVISEDIALGLRANYAVERVYGIDRYETAVAAGNVTRQTKITDTAIIATGLNFPDAMAIAPFAAKDGTPVLYTSKDSLNADTEKALKDWGIKKVIITGGTGVISAEVENHIRNVMNIQVIRLGGYDRYLTSMEIAKYYDQSYDYKGVVVATGDVFADALSGASFAAREGCPVLLVPGRILEDTLNYIDSLKIGKYYILGGPGAVAE